MDTKFDHAVPKHFVPVENLPNFVGCDCCMLLYLLIATKKVV